MIAGYKNKIEREHQTIKLYTYSEWEKIYKQKERETKQTRLYYIKQKLSGLLLTAAGFVLPLIAEGDATASIILVPLGIFLIVTKEKAMMF